MKSTVFDLARKHIGKGDMASSARLCLEDAIRLNDAGMLIAAELRALKSLGYSVGIFHPDYDKAKKITMLPMVH